MTEPGRGTLRSQSPGEELANTLSHGVGLVGALVGLPVLVISSLPHGLAATLGAIAFGASVIALYLSSTLYHAVRRPKFKHILRTIDHGAIYLLIAGTYTPFTLGVLRGWLGWTMFAIVWTMALVGVVIKVRGSFQRPRLSTGLYLAMGWLILVAAKPLWDALPGWGLFWLAAGGLAYTVGVAFYSAKRMRYAHFVWHLFVMTGTACHFVAVLRYAAA